MIRHRHAAPVPPSRVVVLGASGFVGRALVEEMTRLGIETLPLSSRESDLCRPESTAALRGLLRPEDTLAVVSAITPDKGKDVQTLMRNLLMGQHVSAALEEPACSHVVYISSDAVYNDAANPVRETSCCSPSTFHGLMHVGRELMLTQAVKRSQIPLLILRPSALYGAEDPHQSYGPNRFARTAVTEHVITLFGHGEEKRDHLYIKDLSRLITLGVLHGSQGILNVATGVSTSFYDVAQAVVGLLEQPVQIEYQPRSSPVTHRYFDTTAVLKAFPTFRFTSLQEGLASCVSTEMAGHG
ncbi:MAG: NAD(P)-dependent oxidoreductase [Candidatus Omnitrophota bacterium]|nr:NAD(P)-dependent oxidoreductase [Candidatus Omnitrophota bacterium]